MYCANVMNLLQWVDARNKFIEAADLIDAEKSMRKSMWGQYWSAHQRFFKYLCISSKVRYAVSIAKEALRKNKCVVIGLQSTGEARTLEQLEEMGGELNDFVSTAKWVVYIHYVKQLARLVWIWMRLESSQAPVWNQGSIPWWNRTHKIFDINCLAIAGQTHCSLGMLKWCSG